MADCTPDGGVHVPAHRSGCYQRRLTDCCFLCYLRLLADGAKGILSKRSNVEPLVKRLR